MYIKEPNRYIKIEDYYEVSVQYKDVWYKFYIDEDDYEKVKLRHWRVSHKKGKIYAVSGSKAKNNVVYMHNYIMNYKYVTGYEVDHIDSNSFNNRKSNLRIVPRLTNIQNTMVRSDSKSGIRGVSYYAKGDIYKCDFAFSKKRYYFPEFKTIEEAVYCRKLMEDHFNLTVMSKNPSADKYLESIKDEDKRKVEGIVDKILRK